MVPGLERRAACRFVGRSLLATLTAILMLASGVPAHAEAIRIVALGESNTAGFGVSEASNYPSKLERMLQLFERASAARAIAIWLAVSSDVGHQNVSPLPTSIGVRCAER
jgi:hypothetical protein